MARVRSSVLSFLRKNPPSWKHPTPPIRHLCVEGRDRDCKQEEAEPNGTREVTSESSREWLDVVTKVCNITRTRPRWEETLLSDFPCFDFSDPCFFRELFRQQGNVLHSLRFFYWLRTRDGFLPDPDSSTRLFDALVEANALSVAKGFLEETGLRPPLPSLERYLMRLCEAGLSGDAIEMVYSLKGSGHSMSIQAWKSVLLCCLNVKRTDLLSGFYHDMTDSNVSREIDVEIIEILIQAFCSDGRFSEAHDLLQGILKDGVVPGKFCFNKLIAGFCKLNNFGKVSEIIGSMIQWGINPDIYTYQEVVNGLCKNGKIREAYRIFSDLKDRGYAPDTVMYTTMIHGLCKKGRLRDATKLWFEMINKKGLVPNEYTYTSLLRGLYRVNKLKQAARLYKEICDRGYGETTVLCNTVIVGLCSHGIIDKAYRLFQEMPQKGVVRDVITFNALIRSLCRGGRILEAKNLLKELLDGGIPPSTSSYTPIIESLSLSGGVQEAKDFLSDMQSRGLEPNIYTHHHIITGLCKEGYIEESMEHLVEMLKSKLNPQKNTFEELMHCLLRHGRLDDSLITLKHMFSEGYSPGTGLSHVLVSKFCGNNSKFAKLCFEGIIEKT